MYYQDIYNYGPMITIQVTDLCNLNCSYCYQINKNNNMMTKETGKQIIDLLFNLYDQNNINMPINQSIQAITLDFIGGEALINMPVIQYISDYFIEQCNKKNHIWKDNHKFHICSNGVLYFKQDFQQYLHQYKNELEFAISIDGYEQSHNACRVNYNQDGSYKYAFEAIKAYRKFRGYDPMINAVIAPENLQYLNTIYDFLLEIDCANFDFCVSPIEDHKWTIEESQEYYKQLIILADKMIQQPKLLLSMFDHSLYASIDPTKNLGSCRGTNCTGLVFAPNGEVYTCLRFSPNSLYNNRQSFCVGNTNKVYSQEIQQKYCNLFTTNKQTHYAQYCLTQCPIATGCDKCAAIIYNETGDLKNTDLNLCWMHRAAYLAHLYFWNTIFHIVNAPERFEIKLDKNIVLNIISKNEYKKLLQLTK